MLPPPAAAFLQQSDDAVLVTAGATGLPEGRVPRVLVAVADRGELRALARARSVPADLRTPVLGVWLDEARAALSYTPRPTPTGPSLRAINARPESEGWLCVLRFDKPVAVAPVLAELARQSVAATAAPVPEAAVELGVDVRVVNPTGFDADAADPVVHASSLPLGMGRGVTEALLGSLRPTLGVRLDVDVPPRDLLALQASGVPLVGGSAGEVDLADRHAREVHSIRQRRRALDRLVPPASRPSVSIVMATRRPEMLDHALAQVGAQRGVEQLELVLAPHGFEPALPPDLPLPVTVVPCPAEMLFGDVLDAAAVAASGDLVLKMDDDDWYDPEFVVDLLRARAYSGADLVGCPDELYHLTEQDRTIHRRHPGERYTHWVAGGTLLLSRGLLREVGGFAPVPRHVDRHLLDALARGGATVYRTHGLGYVLRRNAGGHTYDADLDAILDPARLIARWPGLHLGPLVSPPVE
ncbi:glycosyltransferase family A protein [Nocardioides nanhaiensis]|uniref:Glycosyltransferase family 2 protein n=1 Tax=Nocardioides nanhaiensis TaxID=1476871 RepID=A0ABP8VP76_9ACTN